MTSQARLAHKEYSNFIQPYAQRATAAFMFAKSAKSGLRVECEEKFDDSGPCDWKVDAMVVTEDSMADIEKIN